MTTTAGIELDWHALRALVDTALAPIAQRNDALRGLVDELEGACASVDAYRQQLNVEIAGLDASYREHQDMVRRCDMIVSKSRTEGREDLAGVAQTRRDRHQAEADEAKTMLEAAHERLGPCFELESQLRTKLTEVQHALAKGGAAARAEKTATEAVDSLDLMQGVDALLQSDATLSDVGAGALEVTHEAALEQAAVQVSDPDLSSDSAGADAAEMLSAAALEAAAARVSQAPVAAVSSAGESDWEKELAALMDSEGVDAGVSEPAADQPQDEDLDAILASLPVMAELSEEEISEGKTIAAAGESKALVPAQASSSVAASPPTKGGGSELTVPTEGHTQDASTPATRRDGKRRVWPWVFALLSVGGAVAAGFLQGWF